MMRIGEVILHSFLSGVGSAGQGAMQSGATKSPALLVTVAATREKQRTRSVLLKQTGFS